MADVMDGVVPSEATSSAPEGGTGNLAYLNAEWVNQRIRNVEGRVNVLLKRIIGDGLMGSGYAPFESPVTDDMLARMTPVQFRRLLDSQPTIEQKNALLARMKDVKLPPIELMPFAPRANYPVPSIVAGNESGPVDSSAVV